MQFICDKVLSARQFAECYSGEYFIGCDTFSETRKRLASVGISIDDGVKLTELQKMKDQKAILVEFSTEENYTEHEYRVMSIPEEYLQGFLDTLADMNL